MVFFIFLNFLAIFLEFSIMRRVGTEQNDNFYFLSLSHPFPSYFGFKWSHNGIFYFFQFFCFFFGIFYYAPGWNGTEWNDNFYFLSLLSFSNLFWLQMKPQWYFFIFFNFFAIFLEFSITRREGTKWKYNFYFPSFSSLSNLFWL